MCERDCVRRVQNMIAISIVGHYILSVGNQTRDMVSHDSNAEHPV